MSYIYGCKCLQINDSLPFNLIFIVSFQIQCAGVQVQKNRNGTTAQILTDCTVQFSHHLRPLKLTGIMLTENKYDRGALCNSALPLLFSYD